MGQATAAYPARRMPATVKAVFTREGKAVFATASHEIGCGASTIMTQLAADALGIPMEAVVFQLGDSAFPQAPVAGASQTSASVGPAVLEAASLLKKQLIHLASTDSASPLHGVDSAAIELQSGLLKLNGDSARQENYTAVLNRMSAAELQVEAKAEQGQEKQQFTFESFGAHFAEVLVDPQLGHVRVIRFASVLHGGKILNQKTARSQVLGGITFGIGMALREQTIYDGRTGSPVNPNLAEYLLPVNADVPHIEVAFVDIPDTRFNSTGARGIGELGFTGVPAAITNAIYHATGKHFYELPVTVDKLLS
jgi:xanthine dehydrogenase YagR molybdenum-binding subunit